MSFKRAMFSSSATLLLALMMSLPGEALNDGLYYSQRNPEDFAQITQMVKSADAVLHCSGIDKLSIDNDVTKMTRPEATAFLTARGPRQSLVIDLTDYGVAGPNAYEQSSPMDPERKKALDTLVEGLLSFADNLPFSQISFVARGTTPTDSVVYLAKQIIKPRPLNQ